MIIGQVAHVAVGVEDLDAAAEFYRDVIGLVEVARREGRLYLSGGMSGSYDLVLGDWEPGVDHFAFSVEREDDIDEAVRRLRAAGVQPEDIDVAGDHGIARGVSFPLPSGHVVELVLESTPVSVAGPATTAPRFHGGIGPLKLDHVTLLCLDITATATFLLESLDFRITDTVQPVDDGPLGATFLRARDRHHDIALLPTGGDAPELHHYSFAVPSGGEVIRVADVVASRGVPLDSSPARHAVGGNLAVYFRDPFGTRVEVNTDMARIHPAAKPRVLRQPLPYDAWRPGRPPAMEPGSWCRDARGAAVAASGTVATGP